ncbi:MAG TPA: diacylglycerol kinase family protein [Legionella sp.]|nr:diacylglycerol kinase family protein [Legionella sp.]
MIELAVIINNKAKNAAGASNYLKGLKEAGIIFKLYESDPEKLDSTIKRCITQYPMILVGGGDGSIRTAAQNCANTKTVLGVLALGTLNHFSKELNLPANVAEMVQAVKDKKTMLIDLAEVNGSVFVNNSSIGFYPKFAKRRDLYTKLYNKWLSYIPSFFDSLKKHDQFDLVIKSNELNLLLQTSFLMVSNNVYSYEFPITFKRDDFQKSMLGLYYFKYGKMRFMKLISTWFKNKSNFEIKESAHPLEISFHNCDEVSVALDGDTMKMSTPLLYKSLPQSLNVLIKSSS